MIAGIPEKRFSIAGRTSDPPAMNGFILNLSRCVRIKGIRFGALHDAQLIQDFSFEYLVAVEMGDFFPAFIGRYGVKGNFK